MRTENISTILTPLEEAFMLLYIRVWYGYDTDLILEEGDKIKRSGIKSGWQESSISMYNNFYDWVVADCV